MSEETQSPCPTQPEVETPAAPPVAEAYTWTLLGQEIKAIMDLVAAQPTGSGLFPLLVKLDSQLQTQLMKK